MHLGLGFVVDFPKAPCCCAVLVGLAQLLFPHRVESPLENEHSIRTKIIAGERIGCPGISEACCEEAACAKSSLQVSEKARKKMSFVSWPVVRSGLCCLLLGSRCKLWI